MENKRRINLIPSEMAVPSHAIKISKVISKISVIGVVILIICLITFAGLFVYFNSRLTLKTTNVGNLKTRIASLSQNEQKIVLAKDRIAKIKIVQNDKSLSNEVVKFKEFSDLVNLNPDTGITEANLSAKGTEVTVISKDIASLSAFIKSITNFKDYKKIILNSLNYNQVNGFTLTFNLSSDI